MSQQPKTLTLKESNELNVTDVRVFEQKVNFDEGTEAAQLLFMLVCKHIPVGSIVGFSSDTPGPTPPIQLQPTVVTYPDFTVGIKCYVPANYKCTITYWLDCKENPPPDAQVSLQIYFATN